MLIYNIHRNTLFEPNWKGFDEQSRKITHFFLLQNETWTAIIFEFRPACKNLRKSSEQISFPDF